MTLHWSYCHSKVFRGIFNIQCSISLIFNSLIPIKLHVYFTIKHDAILLSFETNITPVLEALEHALFITFHPRSSKKRYLARRNGGWLESREILSIPIRRVIRMNQVYTVIPGGTAGWNNVTFSSSHVKNMKGEGGKGVRRSGGRGPVSRISCLFLASTRDQ